MRVDCNISLFSQSSSSLEKPFSLDTLQDKIDTLFSGNTLEEICAQLEKEGSEWSLKHLATLRKMVSTVNGYKTRLTRCSVVTHWRISVLSWRRGSEWSSDMHHGILSVGIQNRSQWPWPSRSFWPYWFRIVGNLAFLHDNTLQIWAWITKFAVNMHPVILLAGIENGVINLQGHMGHFDSEF